LKNCGRTKGTFSISQALSDGWRLVSKHLGYYIGAGVITVLIGMFVGFIPYGGSIINNLVVSPCFAASAYIYNMAKFPKAMPGQILEICSKDLVMPLLY
jgi:hypothetical protein